MKRALKPIQLYSAAVLALISLLLISLTLYGQHHEAKPTSAPVSPSESSAPTEITETEAQTTLETKTPETTQSAPETEPEITTAPHIETKPPKVPETQYVQQTVTPIVYPYKEESGGILTETPDAGTAYLDRIVFLGDSRTYGLKFYKMLTNGWNTTQVWTPVNGTLTLSYVNTTNILYPETNTEIPIKEAVRLKQPDILMISLGVNGIAFMNEQQFDYCFSSLIANIREVSPNTRIILQTMYPVSPFYRHINSISNEKILNGNNWIIKIAEKNHVKCLDAYDILADENGYLATEYQNGDGLHPNALGYSKVLQYIRTHAYN